MRTFIVLALVFAVNSSFLRELADKQISTITITESCVEVAASATADVTIALATGVTVSGTFKTTLSSGVDANKIELPGTQLADATSIAYEDIDVSAKHTGVYKVTKVEDTATSNAITFALPEQNTATLTLTVAGTLGTQVADQEVIEGDSTKNSFKIVFTDNTLTAAVGGPVIYTDSAGKKPIADCSILAANLKEVVCKPTAEEMGEGGDVEIYYQNGCGTGKVVTTGATVKFTIEDSSAFMSLGKVALFAFALLF